MRQGWIKATLAGLAAAAVGAIAVPVAPAEAMTVAAAPAGIAATPRIDVQYYYPAHRYYRGYPYYRGGYYPRRAGLYRCGPYAFKTHLSREYCR